METIISIDTENALEVISEMIIQIPYDIFWNQLVAIVVESSDTKTIFGKALHQPELLSTNQCNTLANAFSLCGLHLHYAQGGKLAFSANGCNFYATDCPNYRILQAVAADIMWRATRDARQ